MKKSITLPLILGMFFCGNTNASTIPDWISEQDEQFQANYSELYNYCLAVKKFLCSEIECKNSSFEEFSQTLKVDVQNCLYNNNFGIDKNLPLNFFGEYEKKKAEEEKRANQSDEENACQDAQKQCPSLICDFSTESKAAESQKNVSLCLKNPTGFEFLNDPDGGYQYGKQMDAEFNSISTSSAKAAKDISNKLDDSIHNFLIYEKGWFSVDGWSNIGNNEVRVSGSHGSIVLKYDDNFNITVAE